MAGLNFVGNAKFMPKSKEAVNLAQFELIPYILGQARSIYKAEEMLKNVRLINTPYSDTTPVSELHFFLTDGNISLAAEPEEDGFKIYDNSFGVLTNNPPFPYHRENLNNYMGLTREKAENRFSKKLPLYNYSRGMGAMGLPGDCSSQSRFVRAAFNKLNAVSYGTEEENVNQFFHLLSSVEQIEGTVKTPEGKDVITVYTSCCNTDKGLYYYTTYHNRSITGVDMHRENLDSTILVSYPLRKSEIFIENRA